MTGLSQKVGSYICAVQHTTPSHLQNASFRYDIHIVKPQEVVTYKLCVSEIKSVFMMYSCWSVMHTMLKHHAQNIETSCSTIMLKMMLCLKCRSAHIHGQRQKFSYV